MDALLLARIQFGFTVSFHIVFPALTIGLASYLAVLEGLWLRTGRAVYMDLYHFWLKVFAVAFGMGVVSGLVMAYQFGTNWSEFSRFAGGVTGPLLAYEVLTAFFLEAGFLGVMLFGLSRVGPGLHFLSTVAVAIGTLISATWILASNSWMHTPQGHEIIDGRVVPVDWIAVIFNPSFPYRLAHMVTAAYLATALMVGGSAAWHLLRGRDTEPVRVMLSMALWMLLATAPLQALIGDCARPEHARVPAGEAGGDRRSLGEPSWRGRAADPVRLARHAGRDHALQDRDSARRQPVADAQLGGPDPGPEGLRARGSAQFDHRVLDLPRDGRPRLPDDRAGAVAGCALRRGQRLYRSRPFLRFALLMAPSGLVAMLAGWFTTEIGRQPWIIQGLMRTAEGVSAHSATQLGISLLLFVLVYFAVFGAGTAYMLRLIGKGPVIEEAGQPMVGGPGRPRHPGRPLSAAPDSTDRDRDLAPVTGV